MLVIVGEAELGEHLAHVLLDRGVRDVQALDDRGVTIILCPMPLSGGLNDAIRDRLEKAARLA